MSKDSSTNQRVITYLHNKWSTKLEQLQSLHRRPKIGLVLSGGGAKGFAHIAVIQIFEKYGIPIDYIGGTSIGALVGGLYAIGYTGTQLDSIFNAVDFVNILQNQYSRTETSFIDKLYRNNKYLVSLPFDLKRIYIPMAYSKGQLIADNLTQLIRKKEPMIHDFTKFKIPFFCVATNLSTGQERVFNNGYLIESLLASMALPLLLDPIRIQDTIYVDGGISNNLPIEEMKKKNVDIVIAIDISEHVDRPDIASQINYIDYLFSLLIQEKVNEQIPHADIVITPNMKNFSSIDFSSKNLIYQQGKQAVNVYKTELDDIASLCQQYRDTQSLVKFSPLPDNIVVSQVVIKGTADSTVLLDNFSIKNNERVKISNIEAVIRKVYATGFYDKIYYTLDTTPHNTYKLTIHVQGNKFDNFLRLGIHYDNIFSFGVLANYTLKKQFNPIYWVQQINFSIDAVASNLYRGEIRYFQYNKYIPNFGITANYAFVNPSVYTTINNPIVSPASTFRTVNIQQFKAQIFVNYIIKQSIGITTGIETQFSRFQYSQDPLVYWYNNWNYDFFATSTGDFRNNNTFPTTGMNYSIIYKFIPNKLINGIDIVHSLRATIDGYFPLFTRTSMRLGITGFYLSQNLANYMFGVGGTNEQDYFNVEQFYGYNYASFFTTSFVKAQVGFQVQLYKRHYFQFHNNVMATLKKNTMTTNIFGSFKNDYNVHYGFGITYGWDSPIGPIKINYSYAPTAKNYDYESNALKGVFFISIGHIF